MERNTAFSLRFAATALLIGTATISFAKDRDIEIRGRMLVDDTTITDALLVVEVDGHECVPFHLNEDGRFALSVPAGSDVQLRFEVPGYLTKKVLIDTHNALNTQRAVKLNKRVKFDVQMSRELKDQEYAGPVGTITFLKGSGLMKVRYDRTLVDKPVTAQEP